MAKTEGERSEFAKVSVTLRLPEWLRARMEEAAKDRDRSLNEEINRRLEDSLRADQRFVYERAVIGDPQVARTMRALGVAIDSIKDMFGPNWQDNAFAKHLRARVIAQIVETLLLASTEAPEGEDPMAEMMASQIATKALPLTPEEIQTLRERQGK